MCVTQDEEKVVRKRRTQCHTNTHHDSDRSDWFVSMLHVLQTNIHVFIGEEKVVEEAIIKTTL